MIPSKKYRAIIVDDAFQARKLLKLMLTDINNEIEIIAEFDNAKDAFHGIGMHKPDIVFLDIEMPGESGLQLIERWITQNHAINFEIIFVTAYQQYAIQAFKLSAIDYLLKPFRKTDLESALLKALKQLQLKSSAKKFDVLIHNFNQQKEPCIALPLNFGFEYIPLKDIEYLEALGAYTNFHLSSAKVILVSKNLKYFETILNSLDTFVKINRSNIIHLSCVKSYLKEDRGWVMLKNGQTIKLSPNFTEEFVSKFNKFLI